MQWVWMEIPACPLGSHPLVLANVNLVLASTCVYVSVWKSKCMKTMREQVWMNKTILPKDFINKHYIFCPKYFMLCYPVLLFLQHICKDTGDCLKVRKYRLESKIPCSHLVTQAGRKKIEETESVPQCSTLKSTDMVIFILAKTYLTQPRYFGV